MTALNYAVVPTTNIARETYAAKKGTTGYTPSPIAESQLSPRRKRILFRYSMLDAGRAALAAGTISSAQYLLIKNLYQHPWRKTTASGVVVDVLDLVRNYMSGLAHSAYSAYVTDWNGQILTGTTTTKAWLKASTQMLGANGLGTTAGLIYAIGHFTPA
jgi:hypothetical protein